jgi:hypothetical protein
VRANGGVVARQHRHRPPRLSECGDGVARLRAHGVGHGQHAPRGAPQGDQQRRLARAGQLAPPPPPARAERERPAPPTEPRSRPAPPHRRRRRRSRAPDSATASSPPRNPRRAPPRSDDRPRDRVFAVPLQGRREAQQVTRGIRRPSSARHVADAQGTGRQRAGFVRGRLPGRGQTLQDRHRP